MLRLLLNGNSSQSDNIQHSTMLLCVHTLCIYSSRLLWPAVTIRRHEVKPAPCGHYGAEPESGEDQGGEGGGSQAPPEGPPLQLRRPRSPQVGALGEPHHHHPRDHRVVWEEALSAQPKGRVGGESVGPTPGSVTWNVSGFPKVFPVDSPTHTTNRFGIFTLLVKRAVFGLYLLRLCWQPQSQILIVTRQMDHDEIMAENACIRLDKISSKMTSSL